MKYGYWLPVFGGWLRNVDDEQMPASWEYVKSLVIESERLGYDLTLIAELMLNDIKGIDSPSLEAWSTAAALAAITKQLELLVAVRPSYHPPALFAKMSSNVEQIAKGRLSLIVVSSWWEDEAKRFGMPFDRQDVRYARTDEWLHVVKAAWSEPLVSFKGRYYGVEDLIVEPKPARAPLIYAGGESETAKDLIAAQADVYVMHGDSAERLQAKVKDMQARREKIAKPPLRFGVAAFTILRDSDLEVQQELHRIMNPKSGSRGFNNFHEFVQNSQLEQTLSLEDYSVSNRGLKTGLIGSAQQIIDKVAALEAVGIDLLLMQCSPQKEEMQRFAEQVMQRFR